MTNREIINLFPQITSLKQEYADIIKKRQALEKQQNALHGKIYTLNQVSEIYKGKALAISSFNYIRTVARTYNDRAADFYQNCYDKTKFGGHIYRNIYGQREEIYLGNTYSEAEINTICKDYVALGKLPKGVGEANWR